MILTAEEQTVMSGLTGVSIIHPSNPMCGTTPLLFFMQNFKTMLRHLNYINVNILRYKNNFVRLGKQQTKNLENQDNLTCQLFGCGT